MLNKISIDLSKYDHCIDKLKKYTQLVYYQNQTMNISGFKTYEEIFIQGVIDSIITFEEAIKNFNFDFENKKVLDIGSGAGFPSVPFLIASNNKFHLTIIESISKRCDFLNLVKKELNLNITVINDRAENVKNLNDEFDYITARALGSSVMIYLMSNHLLKQGGYWILPKGQNYIYEVEKFKEKFKLEQNNIFVHEYNEPYNESPSSLIIIQKKKPTPRSWPWNWSKIKNY